MNIKIFAKLLSYDINIKMHFCIFFKINFFKIIIYQYDIIRIYKVAYILYIL